MAEEISLDNYLEKLAAKTPTPGGGSAAALVGALAAALLSMAAKYVSGKAKMPKSRKSISVVAKSADAATRRLIYLMHEDENAYRRLAVELKKSGPANLMRLYKDAIDVPLEVCEIAARSAVQCTAVCRHCRTFIISDVAEAVVLCEAAFLSAELNVRINLCSIQDAAYKGRISRQLVSAGKQIRAAKKYTLKEAHKFLG